jgi:hypothetical protein
MAGRMGQDTVTVKNLEIIEVTADGVLLIKGLVPGSLNSIVVVKKMGTNKKFVPLYKEVVDLPASASEALQAGEPAAEEVSVQTDVASSSSSSDDAKDPASGGDQTHPSDDAQEAQAGDQNSDSPSLNGNQSESSNDDQKESAELVSDSPQDGSVSAANKDDKIKDEKVETKEGEENASK